MPRAIGLALVPRPLGRERDEFPAPVENAARAVMLEEERRVALDLLPLEHAGDRDAVDRLLAGVGRDLREIEQRRWHVDDVGDKLGRARGGEQGCESG